MKNKMIIAAVFVFVIGGAAGFYGGTKYQNSKLPMPQRGSFRQGANGGGMTAGQIIAKDATSVTVQLTDGGSRIVFLTSATPVMKTVSGTSADLAVGTNVIVTGTVNSDNTVTAQSIQLRPNMPSPTPTPTSAAH